MIHGHSIWSRWQSNGTQVLPNSLWGQRCEGLLQRHPRALGALRDLGLTQETIRHFRLGLSVPYGAVNGRTTADALAYPLVRADGSLMRGFAYFPLPGVTVGFDQAAKGGWCGKGTKVLVARSGPKRADTLVVVESVLSLWLLWQGLNELGLGGAVDIVAPTTPGEIADDWRHFTAWEGYERVVAASVFTEPGERFAQAIARICTKPVLRVGVVLASADWNHWFRTEGRTADDWEALLGRAQPTPVQGLPAMLRGPRQACQDGKLRLPWQPVDVHGQFHNGRMYYVASCRVIQVGDDGEVEQYTEPVVVRSDRTLHTVKRAKAPRMAPSGSGAVYYLQPLVSVERDPLYMERDVTPSKQATWDWDNISHWLDGNLRPRPLASILRDVEARLRERVWLPNDLDYALLTTGIAASYVQSVFDAVPLFLVRGEPGTGKTELGLTVASLGANGTVVGQISAASAARKIDSARGLVVFDDLEEISNRSKDKNSFSELVQALKLSYKKSTAKKHWTDVRSGMSVQTLDFFGVKLITNTRGADEILSSRMFTVHTRRRDVGLPPFVPPPDLATAPVLRAELHAWAFEQCEEVVKIYRDMASHSTNREEEIAAPLLTIAAVAGDATLLNRVRDAVQSANRRPQHVVSPLDCLRSILARLIASGQRDVCPTHLRLELAREMSDGHATHHDADWNSEVWIGRQLRRIGAVATDAPSGRVLWLGKLKLRVLRLSSEFVATVGGLEARGAPVHPLAFCERHATCDTCPLRPVPCPVRQIKEVKKAC